MLEEILSYVERFIICLTPIIVVIYERRFKNYTKVQEDLNIATTKLKEKEKEELNQQFKHMDKSIEDLGTKVGELDKKVSEIKCLDKKVEDLIQLSNLNIQFCTSISSVISSIGSSLDASDAIMSEGLNIEISKHKDTEKEILGKVYKICY